MQRWLKRVIIASGILLVLVVGVYAAFAATSTPQFCANCHEISPMVTSWQQFSHNKVSCLHCHANPGKVGYIERKIGGLNEVYKHFTGQVPEALNVRLNQQNCINCHNGSENFPGAVNVYDPNTKGKVTNYKHPPHLALNLTCMKCHESVVHGIYPRNPEKNTNKIDYHPICSSCHMVQPPDAVTVDANKWDYGASCQQCHPSDPRKK